MSRESEILARLAALEAKAFQGDREDPDFNPDIPVFYPTGGGLDVLGTKAKYKVIALREWNNGVITPVGNEGSDLTKLQPTWDYLRMHP